MIFMQHPSPQFLPEERLNAWLELREFTSLLMASSLDPSQLETRIRRMRDDRLREHREFLTRLGNLKI
jgi:hypothetical protein